MKLNYKIVSQKSMDDKVIFDRGGIRIWAYTREDGRHYDVFGEGPVNSVDTADQVLVLAEDMKAAVLKDVKEVSNEMVKHGE